MPELPDITVYQEALISRLDGRILRGIHLHNPFVLRTVEPGIDHFAESVLTDIRRIGKRLAFGFDNRGWLVIHLMIAGRLHWHPTGQKTRTRKGLLRLDFDNGSVVLTEAGSKRRASLHLYTDGAQLAQLDRGGLEIDGLRLATFHKRLTLRNHTLKRALTDPTLFSGIGNAYSDEILHRARLSPIRQTQKLSADEIGRLHQSCKQVLASWTKRLRADAADNFPQHVTAFRDGMAVHGRYQQPCPDCGTAIQRIRYASNETNYCPRCQNDGKLLADRSLSRLLKKDWPKTIEELEDSHRRDQQA